jgi:hypothetical protein
MKKSAGELLQLESNEGGKRLPMSLGGPQTGTGLQPARGPDLTSAFERHYSVKELANLWNLSDRTIRWRAWCR